MTLRHIHHFTAVAAALLLVLGPCHVHTAAGQDVADGKATEVTVRAVSRDAKIIGSAVGGARIVIQNVETGKILADGLQEGGTGDTDHIIRSPIERDGLVYDTEGAAKFVATLMLDEPTVVDITAYGPLDADAFVPRSSKRMLLLPGKHVRGEGVILELNGFTVEMLETMTTSGGLSVRSRVTMLCGCPIEPGGLWDADDIEVTATLMDGDRVVGTAPLSFAGETSTFAGTLDVPEDGRFRLVVTASEPAEGNFGMAETTLEL